MSHPSKCLNLIEVLAKKIHCDFLSDLRLRKNRFALRQALETLQIEDYSLREWNECITYLCQSDLKVTSKIVAYQVIYDYLGSF